MRLTTPITSTAGVLFLACVAPVVGAQATYTTTPNFLPLDMSSDGTTMLGRDVNGVPTLYDIATGTLTPIGGDTTFGGISADGTVAAGRETDMNGDVNPARWDGSWTTLGGLGGMSGITLGTAWDLSDDGTTVVGTAYIANGDTQPFRWSTATGVMENLGGANNLEAVAYGVSGNGSVVVGVDIGNGSGQPRPAVWPSGPNSIVVLGSLDLADPTGIGEAEAVSGDGNVVVGYSGNTANVAEAFRYVNGQMLGLGLVPTASPVSSRALAANFDGSIIVGTSGFAFGARGFLWTQQDGIQDIKQLLESKGATIGLDQLGSVEGVSDNGRVLCGQLSFPGGGYIATIPPDAPVNYCVAKASTAGCLASMSTTGPNLTPTSGANDYSVVVSGAQGQRPGIFLTTTTGPASIPFQGGTLCIASPIKRSFINFTAGTNGACDGSFSRLINDGNLLPPAGTGFDAGPGTTSYIQAWYRSPGLGDGFDIALSDGIEIPWF